MAETIIVDATNLILGRMCSLIAKMLVEGEKVTIINAEKCIITGRKRVTIEEFKKRRNRGITPQGPYYPKMPDKIVRRTIRNMIDYKVTARGKKGYKNLKVFISVPFELEGKQAITFEKANIKKLKVPKYMILEELSKEIGARW